VRVCVELRDMLKFVLELVLQSVTEENFRYSGARLLSFLCEHLSEDNGRKVRSQLLNTYDSITAAATNVMINSTMINSN